MYKIIVRDNIREKFSSRPYPLKIPLKKPKKSKYGGTNYISKKEQRYFKTKAQAKKSLLANHKQNAGVLTPSDLRNTKIVKSNWNNKSNFKMKRNG